MRILLLSISLLFASSLLAQDYYWVGGTGDWSDASHWATSSGGSEFHAEPPTELNDVYLDANSFTATGQVLTLDLANCYCRAFNSAGVQNSPLIRAMNYGDALRAFGNIYLDPVLQRDLRNVVMNAESGVQEIVTSEISLGDNCNLLMGGGADYHLMDSLSVRSCGNSDGRFFTNGHPINCEYSLQSNYGPYREMYLSTSNIHCYSMQINSNMLMDADEAHFYMNGPGGVNNNFWGSGFTYGIVEFAGEMSVTGDNTFAELIIHPGAEISLAANSVQTADQFEFNGTSLLPISLISSEAGTQASIVQTSGEVNGNFMVIRDNNASGGALFTADNSIDQGNNTGWNILENLPETYYWVNGEGAWSDLSHWSASSGGSADFSSLPTAQDTVVFDAMSFAGAGTLDIDLVANCADWRMESVNAGMIIDANADVNIYGSITLAPEIDANFLNVKFKGGNGPYQITSNGTYWGPSSSMIFEVAGEFELADDFEGQAIQVYDGVFRSMGHTIDLDWELKTEGVGNPVLDIINSVVNCNFWRPYEPSQFNYVMQNSVINCGSQFFGNDLTYPEVHLFGIQTSVTGNCTFNYLEVLPGTSLNFQSGNTFTLNEVVLNGTSDQSITIQTTTPGDEAFFVGNGNDVTGQYLNVIDNHASGTASFTAYNSVLGSNVVGWSDGVSVSELSQITAVYPNPCAEVLTVEMSTPSQLDLYSVYGKLLRSIPSNGQNTIRLDVQGLASGMYVLRQYSTGDKGITLMVK